MRWFRRKDLEQDLERELSSDLELKPQRFRRKAFRRKMRVMPPGAPLAIRLYSRRTCAAHGAEYGSRT